MQAIGLRDYRLMPKAAQFMGGEHEVLESARQPWADPAAILHPHAVALEGPGAWTDPGP